MRRRALLAIGAGAAALLLAVVGGAILTTPPPLPRHSARPMELPADLEPFVYGACLPESSITAIGVDGLQFSTHSDGGLVVRVEQLGVWSVDAGRRGVTVQRGDGSLDTDAISSPAFRAVDVAQSLYSCLSGYRFEPEPDPPRSGTELVQLYKYDTTVLWPCLTAHGVDPGPPPTRADFLNEFTASAVTPFRALNPTARSVPRIIAAIQECPLRPAYLG